MQETIRAIIATLFLVILFLTLISILRGAPFVVTDKKTLKKIIELSNIKKGEKVADLGSGDGRIVIEMAKKGARAYGFEINPLLVLWSRITIRRLGLSGKAIIYWKSLWSVDLSDYDLVTVYGISYIMSHLEKKLKKELKKGRKVISHSFKFPNWKLKKSDNGVYLYIK